MPSWIRSSSESWLAWYFFASDTTSRRLELIIRSFASWSPRSMRFASATSSSAVSRRWRLTSFRNSCSASVVCTASSVVRVRAVAPALARAVVAEVDAAALDLLVDRLDLLRLELERLQRLGDLREVEAPGLLAAIDQRLNACVGPCFHGAYPVAYPPQPGRKTVLPVRGRPSRCGTEP